MTRRQHGSTLVMAVIVILAITITAVGIINFASREVAGATAGTQRQALAACAEAARQLLVSRFHAVGQPTSVQALSSSLGQAGGHTMAMGGHLGDTDLANIAVTQVKVLPVAAFGPTVNNSGGAWTQDLTNKILGSGVGGGAVQGVGTPLRVVVHCVDNASGTPAEQRQLEVEFGVRFGM